MPGLLRGKGLAVTTWRHSCKHLPGSLAAAAAMVTDLQRHDPHPTLAATITEQPDAGYLLKELKPPSMPDLLLLAAPAPAEKPGTRFMPHATLPTKTVTAIVRASADMDMIFYADYKSWNEVLTDAAAIDASRSR